MRVLVTGGAGFIGSAVVRHLVKNTAHEVLNVDKLTYAGNLESLAPIAASPRYQFAQADIVDSETLTDLFARFRPAAVLHLAAETRVDRSIDGPAAFIQTNVVGTFELLQVAFRYWERLTSKTVPGGVVSGMAAIGGSARVSGRAGRQLQVSFLGPRRMARACLVSDWEADACRIRH